jgi:hypothetical protein
MTRLLPIDRGRRTRASALGAAFFTFALAACEDRPPLTYPELTERIVFDCPIDCADCSIPAACASLGLSTRIAVGAVWTFDPRVVGIPVDVVVPADVAAHGDLSLTIGEADVVVLEDVVDQRFRLRAVGAGISAVVLHGEENVVRDLVHVRTAVADGLAIEIVDIAPRAPAPDVLEIAVGQVVKLGVRPTAAGGALGGAATATWFAPASESDDGVVVALTVPPDEPTVVEVTAQEPGQTTIEASFESVRAELAVVVR